ncbi:MAG TPA: hypothetical protein VF269_01410 [Rhodanobacteraceae bacterium]
MPDLPDWLPELDPPSGGLTRLQDAVAAQRHRRALRRRGLAWATMAIVPLVALALWLLPPRLQQQHRTQALVAALQPALAPPLPASGLRVHDGAAVALPSGQANVRLYLVQTVAPRSRTPTPLHHVTHELP